MATRSKALPRQGSVRMGKRMLHQSLTAYRLGTARMVHGNEVDSVPREGVGDPLRTMNVAGVPTNYSRPKSRLSHE